jgi:hypothetical protein
MHQSSSATSLLGRLAARLNKPYLSARGPLCPRGSSPNIRRESTRKPRGRGAACLPSFEKQNFKFHRTRDCVDLATKRSQTNNKQIILVQTNNKQTII